MPKKQPTNAKENTLVLTEPNVGNNPRLAKALENNYRQFRQSNRVMRIDMTAAHPVEAPIFYQREDGQVRMMYRPGQYLSNFERANLEERFQNDEKFREVNEQYLSEMRRAGLYDEEDAQGAAYEDIKVIEG